MVLLALLALGLHAADRRDTALQPRAVQAAPRSQSPAPSPPPPSRPPPPPPNPPPPPPNPLPPLPPAADGDADDDPRWVPRWLVASSVVLATLLALECTGGLLGRWLPAARTSAVRRRFGWGVRWRAALRGAERVLSLIIVSVLWVSFVGAAFAMTLPELFLQLATQAVCALLAVRVLGGAALHFAADVAGAEPGARGTQRARTLCSAGGAIGVYAFALGGAADVLYVLSLPSILMTGETSVGLWMGIGLLIGVSLVVAAATLLLSCVGWGAALRRRWLRHTGRDVPDPPPEEETWRALRTSLLEPPLPPPVDLVGNRSAAAALTPCLLLGPLFFFAAFLIGGSALLIGPPPKAPPPRGAAFTLEPMCPAPLHRSLQRFVEGVVEDVMPLLAPNHTAANASANASANLSANRSASGSPWAALSSTLLSSAWSVVLDEMPSGCPEHGVMQIAAPLPRPPLACDTGVVGSECVPLPPIRLALNEKTASGETCTYCDPYTVVAATVVTAPDGCGEYVLHDEGAVASGVVRLDGSKLEIFGDAGACVGEWVLRVDIAVDAAAVAAAEAASAADDERQSALRKLLWKPAPRHGAALLRTVRPPAVASAEVTVEVVARPTHYTPPPLAESFSWPTAAVDAAASESVHSAVAVVRQSLNGIVRTVTTTTTVVTDAVAVGAAAAANATAAVANATAAASAEVDAAVAAAAANAASAAANLTAGGTSVSASLTGGGGGHVDLHAIGRSAAAGLRTQLLALAPRAAADDDAVGGGGRVVTSTSVEERPAKQVLVFTTRPPDAIAPGETAVVKLALLDELGAPVRGEPVEMMLLAPPGSGRLAKGSTVVTTDAHGAASFTLQFDRHSHSAGYGLLFGTAKSFGAGSLPNLLEALKRALLRVYRRLQATGLAGLEQLSTVASDVLGPQAGALARGLALSPEVRAILGDAVNVSAAAALNASRVAERLEDVAADAVVAAGRLPVPLAPLVDGLRRRSGLQLADGLNVDTLRALASDVLGGAVPMKPGSGRHFAGGCPSFAKGTSATAVAAAAAWRAELRALRQMLETAVTAGTAAVRDLLPPGVALPVAVGEPHAYKAWTDEASRRVMAEAEAALGALNISGATIATTLYTTLSRLGELRHEITKLTRLEKHGCSDGGGGGGYGGALDAETLFPVDEKLLGWITAGANISVAANASLNPMATRAAAAADAWLGSARAAADVARTGAAQGAEALEARAGRPVNPALKGVHAAVSAFQQVAAEAASGDGIDMRALLPKLKEQLGARAADVQRAQFAAQQRALDACLALAGAADDAISRAATSAADAVGALDNATEQANGALHDAVGTLHGGAAAGGDAIGDVLSGGLGAVADANATATSAVVGLSSLLSRALQGQPSSPNALYSMVTASGAVANVTAAADGAVADASATVEGAAAKFASFASTMSKVALTTAGDAADAVGLDKKCTAAAMDPLSRAHSWIAGLVDAPEEAGAEALAAISSMSGQLPPAARSALGSLVDDAGSALASLSSLSGANLTAGLTGTLQAHVEPKLSDALGGLDGLLQAGTGADLGAILDGLGAAGKLPKDASFSMATHVDGATRAARNHSRSAAEVCYATTALASSTGSLLLDGLGSGSDEQMRAELGEMLDALVLLLQSAATQYGVRAEVDAYVLPLVTLVQQAVLGPAGRAKTTARKRAATAARRRRRSLSMLATGQEDDETAADGDGDGDGLPDVAAEIAASAGAWAQQLALAALDELSSELMPPVALVSLLPPPPQQKVASVLLSAPLVGYGVSTADDSVTARAVPGGGGSSLPASSCASFGYPHFPPTDAVVVGNSSGAAPLWELSALSPFKWLLDAGVDIYGAPRKHCPYNLTDASAVMGTVPPKPEGYFTRFWGRWGLSRLHLRAEYDAVRELYDEAAALAAAGNESEAAARRAEAHECFVDTRSLMRTEVLALCRESYLATGQMLPSTIVPPPDAEAVAADGRRTILRVLDGSGAPIAGKTCTVHEVGGGALDVSPFVVTVASCGPSNDDGEIAVEGVRVSGGSSRPLSLELRVDGVAATADPTSAYRFDSQLLYVSADEPSIQHLGAAYSYGHDASQLLILAGLLLSFLNAGGWRGLGAARAGADGTPAVGAGGAGRPPPLLTLFALLGLLGVAQLVSELTVQTFYRRGDGDAARLSVLGSVRDIVATRGWESASTASAMLQGAVLFVWAIVLVGVTAVVVRDDVRLEAWRQRAAEDIPRMAKARWDWAKGRVRRLLRREGNAEAAAAATPAVAVRILQRKKTPQQVQREWLAMFEDESPTATPPPSRPDLSLLKAPLIGTADGALEPSPAGFERHDERRQRCARNYVRKLLRGRRWLAARTVAEQRRLDARGRARRAWDWLTFGAPPGGAARPHAAYETSDDFFYPQRLWFALVLTMWMQLLLALVLANMCSWAALHAQRAAHNLEQLASLLDGEGERATALPKWALAAVVALGYLAPVGDAAADVVAIPVALLRGVSGSLVVAAYGVGFVQLCLSAASWRVVFANYKRQIFALRRGRYFFDRRSAEVGASSYVAYSAAHSTFFALLVFWVLLFLGMVGVAVSALLTTLSAVANLQASGDVQVGDLADAFAPPPPSPPPPFTSFPPLPPLGGADWRSDWADQLGKGGKAGTRMLRDLHAEALAKLEEMAAQLARNAIPALLLGVLVPLVLTFVLNRFVFFEVSRTRRHGTVSTTWLRLRWWYAWYEVGLVLPNLAVGAAVLLVRLLMWMAMGLFYLGRLELAVMPSGRVGAFDPSFHVYLAMLRADHRYTNPVALVFFELLEGAAAAARVAAAGGGGGGGGGEERKRALRARNRWQLARLLIANPSLRARRGHALLEPMLPTPSATPVKPDDEEGKKGEHGCLVCLGRVKEQAAERWRSTTFTCVCCKKAARA